MWYGIIAGSIFLILEILAFLSLTPLKNKYEFFEFINHCFTNEGIDDISMAAYTIMAAIIASLFPFAITLIVSYFISCFIVFIIKNLKRKN